MSYALVEAMKCLEKVKAADPASLKCLKDAMQFCMETAMGISKSTTIAAGDQTDCNNFFNTTIHMSFLHKFCKNSITTAIKVRMDDTEYSIAAGKIWAMRPEVYEFFKRKAPDLTTDTLANFQGVNGEIQHITGW